VTAPEAPTFRYDRRARLFHWATAGLLAVAIPVAVLLAWAPPEGALKFRLYTLHESIGLTVWVLTLARLAWRRRHPPPPNPALSPLVRRASKTVHGGLYACLLAMPPLGWAANSALGFPPHLWWLVELPAIAPAGKALGFGLLGAHRALGYAIVALLAAHVAGALWHHLVVRDDTLRRMLPAPRPRAG
jgi:cytochrome b561